ncbi:MAG: DUF3352 domain-containing protein [Oscillatoriaceae bacterium SKW80]|nr:DUF3352 domain-containing protein [Oscillatoriaceae bacterium SKYG93]MCX8121586.1 DUF3352 domain-containing protein [Oscillatoriaceae bacterium SKW80]MDW8452827.1 DUF3352 domain-containing protein [Oscillatoriaceae cyanobacterium SKYGB_i_bin93]HIK27931.1 DUF3352 domain-containing protein [Oscillatoriaceae cyanobacterium M7585_C2015_266]
MDDSLLKKTKSAIEKFKHPRLLIAGGVILLIGGGIAAYLALVQKGPSGNIPLAANIIPQDVFVAVSVSTNKRQWQKLRDFGTNESRALLDEYLEKWQELLKANGYDYEQDIQPWVGREIAIAFLPSQASLSTNKSAVNTNLPIGQESVVIILPIENAVRAKALLENPKPLKQGQWVERTYKNVKIREIQGLPDGSTYSIALFDERFMVVTNHPQAIDLAIDTYKGSPSLTTTPGYSEALAKIETSNPLARVYINVPAALAVAAIHSAKPIPPQAQAPLKEQQGFATNITLEPEGIRFNSVSWLKPDTQKKHRVENRAKEILSRLPSNTLMTISGSSLAHMWQDYAEGARFNPLTPMNPEWLQKGVASSTGMDWEKDFIAWMDGEFSLSLLPAAENNPSQFPSALMLMVRASNRRLAEKSLERLDKVMRDRYKFKVEEVKVANQPVINWTSQFGGVTLSRGWLNGNIAFLTLGAPVASAITPKPQAPLALNPEFQKAFPSPIDVSSGNFFIDIERMNNAQQFAFLDLPPVPKTILAAIRTIGVNTVMASERIIHSDILIRLKQEKPGALPPKKTSPPLAPTTPPAKQAQPSPTN